MIIEKEVLNLINPKGRRDPKGLAIASASALAFPTQIEAYPLGLPANKPINNKA